MKETKQLYTRWVEIKLADGRTVQGKKRATLVDEGASKPALNPDIEAEWIARCEAKGQKVIKIGFKYRKR